MKHADARAWSGYEAASYFCPERRTPPGFPDPPFFSSITITSVSPSSEINSGYGCKPKSHMPHHLCVAVKACASVGRAVQTGQLSAWLQPAWVRFPLVGISDRDGPDRVVPRGTSKVDR